MGFDALTVYNAHTRTRIFADLKSDLGSCAIHQIFYYSSMFGPIKVNEQLGSRAPEFQGHD